jgi:hypothetical protein
MFLTRPRDFRSGVFKFRSTPSGSLPADQDLFANGNSRAALGWDDRPTRFERIGPDRRRPLYQNFFPEVCYGEIIAVDQCGARAAADERACDSRQRIIS